MLCVVSTAFALAATPRATLTRNGEDNTTTTRAAHHAHKAGKHHTPKSPITLVSSGNARAVA